MPTIKELRFLLCSLISCELLRLAVVWNKRKEVEVEEGEDFLRSSMIQKPNTFPTILLSSIDRNMYPQLQPIDEHAFYDAQGNNATSSNTCWFETILRNLLEYICVDPRKRVLAKLSSTRGGESMLGKSKGTREIWSGLVGKGREFSSIWESTLLHSTRISTHRLSSLTKEVNRNAGNRTTGHFKLASFVGRSMESSSIATKFINTTPFARLSRIWRERVVQVESLWVIVCRRFYTVGVKSDYTFCKNEIHIISTYCTYGVRTSRSRVVRIKWRTIISHVINGHSSRRVLTTLRR